MTVVWVVLAALVGGFAGGMGATSAGAWLRRTLERRHSRGRRAHSNTGHLEDERAATSDDVQLIRGDVADVKGVIEQVYTLVSLLYKKQERDEKLQKHETLQKLPGPSGPKAPSGRSSTPPVERVETRRSASPRRDMEFDWGERVVSLDPEPAPAQLTPAPSNAIHVEARDDRLVPTNSYPPEAWVELRGPASGNLWLNPDVALTEYALRRLSTFFHWETERTGVGYETQRPAQVQWDEGRGVGTVIERGSARPR